jgi:hypothetical protein
MIYIGAVQELFEKTALVKEFPGDKRFVLAQFDDMTITFAKTELPVCFGWSVFYKDEFKEKL